MLASKITAPGLPDWAVPRPRISRLIGHGARCRALTVVTGPAGAGKTMALALWAAAEPGPVAWVALDNYDNRPKTFWPNVIAALRQAGVSVPGALLAATQGRAVDHLFLPRLASALAARNPPVTLVLDDFHLLTGPKVLDGLGYVLRNARPALRLVVCSRTGPLLPLHRYRLAGELTEIGTRDLAFSSTEAGLLMARHGRTLPTGSLERLTRRTEGWAAGLRLAAISAGTRHRPDQFAGDLTAEDSAVTGYLVAEVLGAQPPQVRDMLLSTSILERVNAEAASELAGSEQAGGEQAARDLAAVADACGFVQPLGDGWYRYHTLLAEVLVRKLRREHPDRVVPLHRRAAMWCERNGLLAEAVRHAAEAGDWQLASSMVIDGLAISEIIKPRGNRSLAGRFRNMPHGRAWTEAQPLLVSAAVALSAGRHESGTASLSLAEAILAGRPAGQDAASRLAAAMIRLAASRRTGDLAAAAAAAARAEMLAAVVPPGKLARHPEIPVGVLSGRGAVELWSGHLDEAARVLDSAAAAAVTAGSEYERAGCLGYLALAEALRGRLRSAVKLASRATAAGRPHLAARHPNSAALVALAWAHLERNELRQAGGRLKQARAALDASPDKLLSAVGCLIAAGGDLAEGRPGVAMEMTRQARCGWSVPQWLEQWLSLVESQACAAAGDIRAAVAAAGRGDRLTSPEAAVTLARAWAAAGDRNNARHALAPALAATAQMPERARLRAWLADAQLSYDNGEYARGRRSLQRALRLGEPEQLRLPFAMQRTWLRPVLRRDPALARAHRHLLGPALISSGPVPASQATAAQMAPVAVQQLSEREREVLRYTAQMLSAAEVASELNISVHTVKTHLKHIYRKLQAAHRREAVYRARQLRLI